MFSLLYLGFRMAKVTYFRIKGHKSGMACENVTTFSNCCADCYISSNTYNGNYPFKRRNIKTNQQ